MYLVDHSIHPEMSLQEPFLDHIYQHCDHATFLQLLIDQLLANLCMKATTSGHVYLNRGCVTDTQQITVLICLMCHIRGPSPSLTCLQYTVSSGTYTVSSGTYTVSSGIYTVSSGTYTVSGGIYTVSSGTYT